MSDIGIKRQLERLQQDYFVLAQEVSRIRQLLEEKDKLKPLFLESSATVRLFGETVSKMIDEVIYNENNYLNIMGYFDQAQVHKLHPHAKRVRIISHSNVKERGNRVLKNALERMLDYGAQVKINEELHARIIITNKSVIIGSGDLQARCLSGNRVDACMWSDHPEVIISSQKFFNRIWKESEYLDTSRTHIKTKFFDDYEDYDVGSKLLTPWIVKENKGKIIVTDKPTSKWKSKKCVKIWSPQNSRTHLRYKFEPLKKVIIDYYLRQEEYNDIGIGSPFIIESPTYIKRNNANDYRAIYMDILQRKLRKDLGSSQRLVYEDICEIELKKWYHIVIDIDCLTHTYICKVNNRSVKGFIPEEFQSINAIRTKIFSQEWTTYIGRVKITKK